MGELWPDMSIFEPISGYEDVKRFMVRALNASRPVHVLLSGPPMSGKTAFLMCISKLPKSAYFNCAMPMLRHKDLDLLLFHSRPRYLLLDEIDKMPRDWVMVLLRVMDGETLITYVGDEYKKAQFNTWVIGACTDDKVVKNELPKLYNRFKVVRLKA